MEQTAEKISRLLDVEIEVSGGSAFIKKKRSFRLKSGKHLISVTLDLDISFSSIQQDGTASNKAEIIMLPEEFPVFSAALLHYPIPLPITYSQRFAVKGDLYKVQLESQEIPENFVERLEAALLAID
ncbi:DUF1259 domain-containing protein [Planococcus sp. YIM B11945]|uniref:DUF1259 domain-containing protein n=1 Tax=Planococcus sp. YIM B11945 TaxID=3435410 RepID=UPI003D7E8323